MVSPYGLDILCHVIEDGRARLAPRAIRENGTIASDATGADIHVTTDWLKEAFPATRHTDPGPSRPSYSQAVLDVRTSINDLSSAQLCGG